MRINPVPDAAPPPSTPQPPAHAPARRGAGVRVVVTLVECAGEVGARRERAATALLTAVERVRAEGGGP